MKTSEKANKGIEHCGFTCKLLLGMAALCVVTLGTVLTASASGPPTAVTESGLVIGFRAEGMNQFLGVPYAAPPVGSLRWTPPQRYGTFPGSSFKIAEIVSASVGPRNARFPVNIS